MILVWAATLAMFMASVTLHELAHGLVAAWLGDDTAKSHGRLTLNPLRHIDFFWTILLPALLMISTGGRLAIGQAKPVPINFQKLKFFRLGMMAVALAGPLVNLALAFFLVLVYRWRATEWLLAGVYLNLALGIFNLLPFPPLDGSRVLAGMLPWWCRQRYLALERYGLLLVVVLVYFGVLGSWVQRGIRFFCALFGVPAMLF